MGGPMSSQELPYSLSETLFQGPSAEESVSPASWMPDPAREVIERTSHEDPYIPSGPGTPAPQLVHLVLGGPGTGKRD